MQINGKEFGVKYNMYAMEMIGKIKGAGAGKPDSGNVAAMVWVGYCAWCYAKQIDEQFTFEEISDYIETVDIDKEAEKIVVLCNRLLTESKAYEKVIKKAKEAEAAKALESEKKSQLAQPIAAPQSALPVLELLAE